MILNIKCWRSRRLDEDQEEEIDTTIEAAREVDETENSQFNYVLKIFDIYNYIIIC